MFASIVAAAAVAVAPASEQPSENLDRTAERAWMACLIKNARDLDDGVSDAKTIASAVAPLCADLWRLVRRDLVAAQPKSEQWAMLKATEATGEEMALSVVLKVRKHDAKPVPGPAQ